MASSTQKKSKTKKLTKKKTRKQIEDKLSTALSGLQKEMGKKRFQTAVKKAGKLFVGKLDKKSKKPKAKTAKPVSKAEPAAETNN